ncbi:zinc finger MYM-type protein 1-like [Athalia rosae]|uniref:zinc finger MYM-type protein 1-like n=1 Tax=Athalia rosae TaxID=37344 RepID=UPI0020348D3A|nr:zinc finger MYM-type protein 1-like [Athalia rosae]
MDRKKKSGWEFIKKRLAQEKELQKYSPISSFLTKPETISKNIPKTVLEPTSSSDRIKNIMTSEPPSVDSECCNSLAVIENIISDAESDTNIEPSSKHPEHGWPKTGSSDWVHLSRNLSIHEKSASHAAAFKEWKEFDLRLLSNRTIDAENQRAIDREITHWRSVLERIVSIIQFLSSQSLAFRGASEKLYEHNNGNFLKLIELFAKFDPVMAKHISCIINKDTRPHYLSNVIQNEIISLITNKIRNVLLNLIKSAKYYSIILDCTPDISHVEQMSIIIRFVAKQENSNEFEVREHFLGFLPVYDTSGEGLTTTIFEELAKLDIPIENMRGQGYDNGANMKGKRAGVQNRILSVNPRAFFVPCSAHTLNLVVNDAASASGESWGFFQAVQKIYTFFSSSTYRWDVLKKYVTSLTVKSVSDTRWESRIEAVKPLRYQLGEIYDALLEISNDKKKDHVTQHEARSLAISIADFRFICSVVIWYDILSKVNVVSKMLQNPKLNLLECKSMLRETVAFFNQYRSEGGFATVLQEATGIASEVEVEPIVRANAIARIRRKKRTFDYECEDEPISDPKDRFKVDFFYFIIDTAINSTTERFQLLESHCSMFEFLYDIYSLKGRAKEEIMKSCKDLHIALTHSESMDTDAIELCDELINLATLLSSSQTPIQCINYIVKADLESLFPNVLVVLRILMTLPVSVASGERSFSKLKIIKNYLRSTMSQERLVGLATISIESELSASIKYNELIDEFARVKARKVPFL